MIKRTRLLVSIFLIAALFLTGCGQIGQSRSPLPPLKVEWTRWDGDYTILVAQEKGLFKKHGVEVELLYYDVFSKAITDMAAQRIDAGLFGVGDMLMASRLTDVKGILLYDSGGTSTIVSRSDIHVSRILKVKRSVCRWVVLANFSCEKC
jgi:NitT/TauT family transport system substrate-binding protein